MIIKCKYLGAVNETKKKQNSEIVWNGDANMRNKINLVENYRRALRWIAMYMVIFSIFSFGSVQIKEYAKKTRIY